MTARRARRALGKRVRRLGEGNTEHGIENEDGWACGPGNSAATATEESSK